MDSLWAHGTKPLVRTLKLLDNVRLNDRVRNGWVGALFLVQRANRNHDLHVRHAYMATHCVPEPEPAFNFLGGCLDASKRLFHKLESQTLRLLDSLRVLRNCVPKVERSRIQVRLGEDAEAGVDITLERQACGQSGPATNTLMHMSK